MLNRFLFSAKEARRKMNEWGLEGTPFFFAIDFEQEAPLVAPLAEIDPHELQYDLDGRNNIPDAATTERCELSFDRLPPTFEQYLRAFRYVQRELDFGNSFLVNLTFPTPLLTSLTLEEIFAHSRARYRLWWRDRLVLFSPETFVSVRNGRIASFPMKGTIDAGLPEARAALLADPKEKAEHATIVDLLRNDLSQVARRVRVERYRYVERLRTHRGELLQTSSRIAGDLPDDYPGRIGDILFRLLPAGSITGAPKQKTVAIIRQAETGKRGFYTGVCGIFDGRDLDSAVMIRFIEKTSTGLVFRSGGGITAFSDAQREYQELIDKVYLPIPHPAAAGVPFLKIKP